MSSQLLLSELAALSSEAKRKSPEVRAASEAALAALRARPNDFGEQAPSSDAGETLLQPIFLACEGKAASAKVVGIAVSLLQRVMGLRAMPAGKITAVVDLLNHVVVTRADVDVHLKVLQAVATLLSTYPQVHDTTLSKTLQVCFQLQQESRVAVINSTAAATLRQAVMTIFDKVRDEDIVLDAIKTGGEDAAAAAPLAVLNVQLSAAETVTLFPSSADAYRIMRDLNALANNERANFLHLDSLSRTFTLELIESILTNHARLFRNGNHPELLLSLREATCPLLIRASNEQSSFPVTLRLMRIVFVLLRQFSSDLTIEVEILLSILFRILGADTEHRKSLNGSRTSLEGVPAWHRILAMEVVRGLCSDGILVRNLWKWFDGKDSSAKVVYQLIQMLHSVSIENPAVVGKADPEHQLDQPDRSSASLEDRRKSRERGPSSTYASNLFDAASGVASAAVGGFSPFVDGTAVGLNESQAPTVQFIDQLDKAEAPAMHPTYLYLLTMQTVAHLVRSLAAFTFPLYSAFVEKHYSAAKAAPPAVDVILLDEHDRLDVLLIQDMLQKTWRPLLDTVVFFLSARCSDPLFAEVLIAAQRLTTTAGILGLESPRDVLLATLARFALPRSILTRLLSVKRSSDDGGEMAMSQRNRACLKAMTQVAYNLAGSLETHWTIVLETLCDAQFVLSRELGEGIPLEQGVHSDSSVSTLSNLMAPAASTPQAVFGETDTQHLLNAINKVFSATGSLDTSSLLSFLVSLCDLDADQIGLKGSVPAIERAVPLSQLGVVTKLNVNRLSLEKTLERGWMLVTRHYLTVIKHVNVRPSLRMQAAEGFAAFLSSALEQLNGTASSTKVQERVIDALAEQCILDNRRRNATDTEVRRIGLQTLLTMLQIHGHAFAIRWKRVLSIIDSAASVSGSDDEKSAATLVKIAFNALQVICSELLSKLDTSEIRMCMATLSKFVQQRDDVNVALTANGAIWAITAEISTRIESTDAGEINDLWIHVLASLQQLTGDSRMQIRHGAISLFFNVLEQYGTSLPASMWAESVMPQTVLPLLENLRSKLQDVRAVASAQRQTAAEVDKAAVTQWEESYILALTATGRVVRQGCYEKLLHAPRIWDMILDLLGKSFMDGPDAVSQASMKSFHQIVDAFDDERMQADGQNIIWKAWSMWRDVGGWLPSSSRSFSQPNLLAYVEASAGLHRILGPHLSPLQLDEMLTAWHNAMLYDKTDQRISDAERLSPLQSAIFARMLAVQLTATSSARILQVFAEFSLLAFSKERKQTYLAVNRSATEIMIRIYDEWSLSPDVYESGAVAKCFDALALPVRLRYQCPAITGRRPDLWKGSLIALCKLASLWCTRLDRLRLNADTVSQIWTSLSRAFASALQANFSALQDMSADMQETEDMYDLMVLATLEREIWRRLGHVLVPAQCTEIIAGALVRSSQLTDPARLLHGSLTPPSSPHEEEDAEHGEVHDSQDKLKDATSSSAFFARERLAYWCFDLLIMFCSRQRGYAPATEKEMQRVAVLALPSLVKRIRQTLVGYIAQVQIAGATPLPRTVDEEVAYILDQLGQFALWPASFEVALKPAAERRKALASFTAEEHGALATLASGPVRSDALLCYLYPLLCDFLLEVTPRGAGRTSSMPLVSCGSSQIYTKPVELPTGFSLGRVGRRRRGDSQTASTKEGSYPAEERVVGRVGEGQGDRQRVDDSRSSQDDTAALPSWVPNTPEKADPRRLARQLLANVGANWT